MKKILIVDSDLVFQDLLQAALREAHYDVQCAQRGDVALEVIKRYGPDLVLLEILIPEVDGLQVMRELKANMGFIIPTLVVTCLEKRETVVQAIVEGAIDVLVKPVPIQTLLAKIAKIGSGPSSREGSDYPTSEAC